MNVPGSPHTNSKRREENIRTRIHHYWILFSLACTLYGAIFGYIWWPTLFDAQPDENLSHNILWLRIVASVLGLSWLSSAYLEVLYLQQRIGSVLTEDFLEDILEVAGVIVLWAVLVMCGERDWIVVYTSVYFLYVLYATVWVQPILQGRIRKLADSARGESWITEHEEDAIVNYYCGRHWRLIGTESVALSYAAGLLGVWWTLSHKTLWENWILSPYLALTMEILISQYIIFAHRIRFYRALRKKE